MILYFITGNKNKFDEACAILGDSFAGKLEQLDIDLPEIQHIDAREVVKEKLQEALKHHDGPLMVEDVSFEMNSLNGFPGPLVKWMIEAIGVEGLYKIANKIGNLTACSVATIGYAKNKDEICFFEGRLKGKLVPKMGTSGFAFDRIFVPDGYTKRFSEMTEEEKNEISHRHLALDKLKKFLENKEGAK